MLDHYIKAAKALDIDIDKIYSDMARALVREELSMGGTKIKMSFA